MLDAAQEAAGFARGRTRKDLDCDRLLALALVKCVEIVGEAASQVSAEARAEAPLVPWQDIINMRHRLVHAYFDINRDILWSTVREDLPTLIRRLESVAGF
jgi:uncharacterized protein with HEPN domain